MQSAAGTIRKDDRSVEAEILRCLHRLPLKHNELKVSSSSRTDTGVHSLANTIKVDLQHSTPGKLISTYILMTGINSMLSGSNKQLRVLGIQRVPDDFQVRGPGAIDYRSYVYRLAIARTKDAITCACLPLYEWDRSMLVIPPFNMDKFLQAASVLSGKHDFTKFSLASYFRREENQDKNPVRTVEIGVKRGCTMFDGLRKDKDDYEMFEVHIRSNGFMYRQVRRMVGTMVDVARERVSLQTLRSLLDDPYNDYDAGRIKTAPAHGLYLSEVKYFPHKIAYHGDVDHIDDMDMKVILKKFMEAAERSKKLREQKAIEEKFKKLRKIKFILFFSFSEIAYHGDVDHIDDTDMKVISKKVMEAAERLKKLREEKAIEEKFKKLREIKLETSDTVLNKSHADNWDKVLDDQDVQETDFIIDVEEDIEKNTFCRNHNDFENIKCLDQNSKNEDICKSDINENEMFEDNIQRQSGK